MDNIVLLANYTMPAFTS